MNNNKNTKIFDDSLVIGKPQEEALKIIKRKKYMPGLARVDSTNYCKTDDLNFNRILIEVDNNIVTKVHQG